MIDVSKKLRLVQYCAVSFIFLQPTVFRAPNHIHAGFSEVKSTSRCALPSKYIPARAFALARSPDDKAVFNKIEESINGGRTEEKSRANSDTLPPVKKFTIDDLLKIQECIDRVQLCRAISDEIVAQAQRQYIEWFHALAEKSGHDSLKQLEVEGSGYAKSVEKCPQELNQLNHVYDYYQEVIKNAETQIHQFLNKLKSTFSARGAANPVSDLDRLIDSLDEVLIRNFINNMNSCINTADPYEGLELLERTGIMQDQVLASIFYTMIDIIHKPYDPDSGRAYVGHCALGDMLLYTLCKIGIKFGKLEARPFVLSFSLLFLMLGDHLYYTQDGQDDTQTQKHKKFRDLIRELHKYFTDKDPENRHECLLKMLNFVGCFKRSDVQSIYPVLSSIVNCVCLDLYRVYPFNSGDPCSKLQTILSKKKPEHVKESIIREIYFMLCTSDLSKHEYIYSSAVVNVFGASTLGTDGFRILAELSKRRGKSRNEDDAQFHSSKHSQPGDDNELSDDDIKESKDLYPDTNNESKQSDSDASIRSKDINASPSINAEYQGSSKIVGQDSRIMQCLLGDTVTEVSLPFSSGSNPCSLDSTSGAIESEKTITEFDVDETAAEEDDDYQEYSKQNIMPPSVVGNEQLPSKIVQWFSRLPLRSLML